MPPEVKKMVDTIQEKAGAAARLIIVPTKLRLSLGTRARLIDDVWNWTVAQTSRVAEAQWLHMQSLVTTEYETPSALQPSQDT
jgi:hypothetical protein